MPRKPQAIKPKPRAPVFQRAANTAAMRRAALELQGASPEEIERVLAAHAVRSLVELRDAFPRLNRS